MNSELTTETYTGFELYLEGVKVPFSTFNIVETEGGFPTASVSMIASSGIMRTLPGTIVQFFGPDPLTKTQILLFEGEIVSSAYQKSAGSGRSISFNAKSLLSKWSTVTARPSDALVTLPYRVASGEMDYLYINHTKQGKEAITPESVENYKQIISQLKEKQEEQSFGELQDMLTDLSFTQKADFADEFSQLFGEEDINRGDLYNFFLFFLRKFENYDPYYGIQANSYDIASSMFVFPNIGKMEGYKNKAVLENTFKIANSMKNPLGDSSLVLMAAIQELLNVVQYRMINSSAPTSAYNF